MSQNIYSQAGKVSYGIKTYTVDAETDKANLPTNDKMGTKCYVIESQKWYILNSNGEYVPFVDAGGSGSSGSPFDIKGSVPTVADLPDTGNKNGDLYIVTEDSSEYVWIDGDPTGHWEQLSQTLESEFYVINLNFNEQTFETVSDKSYEEILAAYQNNKILIVKIDNSFYYFDNAANNIFTFFGPLHVFGTNYKYYTFATYKVSNENNTTTWVYNAYDVEKATRRTYSIDASLKRVILTPSTNMDYTYGTLDSLTITNPPTFGSYTIKFISGSTPTTTTIPISIIFLEPFVAEANTRYRINIEDNYATVDSWPTN